LWLRRRYCRSAKCKRTCFCPRLFVPLPSSPMLIKRMKLSKEHIERLREMLERPGQRIVIVSHTNPDGDPVGSSLAWAEVLRTMGHEVMCVVPNKFPYFLDWMPGIDEVVVFKTDTEGRVARAIAEADILF